MMVGWWLQWTLKAKLGSTSRESLENQPDVGVPPAWARWELQLSHPPTARDEERPGNPAPIDMTLLWRECAGARSGMLRMQVATPAAKGYLEFNKRSRILLPSFPPPACLPASLPCLPSFRILPADSLQLPRQFFLHSHSIPSSPAFRTPTQCERKCQIECLMRCYRKNVKLKVR